MTSRGARQSPWQPLGQRLATLLGTVATAAICMAMQSAGAACFRAPSVGNTMDESIVMKTVSDPVVLEVENHNWSDINIFVLHDGRRHRLTTVTAAKNASVAIPKGYQGETGVFRLVVVRIGGRDSYTSDPISVRTGTTVRLTVESDLVRSSVGVW